MADGPFSRADDLRVNRVLTHDRLMDPFRVLTHCELTVC